jgi:hypothetical protein
MTHLGSGWNMHIFQILLGIAVLFFGRRLFWLFVGTAGFVFGMRIAALLIHGRPGWAALVIAIVAGLFGALFAVFLQRFAIAVAGFMLGGYVLPVILGELGWGAGYSYWVLFLVGGIAGLFLVSVLFDWALIILSSISGAVLILEPLHAGMTVNRPLIALLIAIGIVAQARLIRKDPGRRR